MDSSKKDSDQLIRGIQDKNELSDKDFYYVDADDMLNREYPGVSDTLEKGNNK